MQVRERLYGLVSPATDGIVTADQVIETIANTKSVRLVIYFIISLKNNFLFVEIFFANNGPEKHEEYQLLKSKFGSKYVNLTN